MNLEAIIGLEIHVQLKTQTKMFCGCSNDGENRPPNTTVCPICLGHPGTLPVPNKQALEYAIKAGLALNCSIAQSTKFDRKNYFYPDLPKAYQISQFDEPICGKGFVEIIITENSSKKFGITRLHMEEDAGKNTHDTTSTLVDFNRGGTPLIEIVTEPDFRTPQEAKLFLQELRALMRYLNISDADMEKGHLRCDVNISLRPVGEQALYPKTEIKNVNSFKAVERALEYEIKRQTDLWISGQAPSISTTRGWNEDQQITVEQRTKEDSQDYRYFPEPDIPRINIEPELITNIKAQLPELPLAKRRRFHEQYNLSLDILNQIVLSKSKSRYFENVISELQSWLYSLDEYKNIGDKAWEDNKEKLIKLVTSWMLSKLPPLLDTYKLNFADKPVTEENFAELLSLIHKDAINNQAALQILEKMVDPKFDDQDPSHIMELLGLAQIDNQAEIENIAKQVLNDNPDQVDQYKSGKTEVMNFLLGQMMKVSKGKANPNTAKEILEVLLK